MTSKEIRDKFLHFFENKGHTIVQSAPMVVKNDPTLMFTNAGMNQFKEWFLGNTEPQHQRVTDTQKCLRVSGKHNDLEEVGHDTYHHTMFEMLGNWSFGDYFKKEAISWAWELLTDVYGIPKERLYATIFEGSSEDKLSEDNEAKKEWLKYLPEERIINGNKKDNFWEMGETGPCGPCSEIHIDLRDSEERKAINGAQLVNTGDPLVIEIWNLVFIQYNRMSDGLLSPLPMKHVDTGMGLERLCMALQGTKSNYDTDLFKGMIAEISRISGKKYEESTDNGIAMRVIADHIRSVSFAIADGQLPSNVKAGYVIRRILRRAVRYGYTFLEVSEPLLCNLVPQLIKDLGDAFPELVIQEELIRKVIKEEEETFLRTLDKGIKLLDTVIKNTTTGTISGKDMFLLYDTYGFPPDLTALIAKENNCKVNFEEFETELKKQKERSRNASAVTEDDWTILIPDTPSEFTGYSSLSEETRIARYRKVKTKKKEYYQLVLTKTPFYAESGGQTGDVGTLTTDNRSEKIIITNTLKENNLPVHITDKLPSDLSGTFTATVDEEMRRRTACNHTATHLLHKALREILGTHVQQKGSLVTNTHLRFDFSHFEKLTDETLRAVERRVNQLIREDSSQKEINDVSVEDAKQMGAMALFGEKYNDKVRVIQFGESLELCGGTHAGSTGEIGFFKITSEGAIAAGVRRIEAKTGPAAESITEEMEDTIKMAKKILGQSSSLISSLEKIIKDSEQKEKALQEAIKQQSLLLKEKVLESKEKVNTINLFQLKGEYDPEVVRNIAQSLKNELSNSVFLAASSLNGKPHIALMITDDLVSKGYNASKEIKNAASLIKGGGGGQPSFATAGGKDIQGIDYALERIKENLAQITAD